MLSYIIHDDARIDRREYVLEAKRRIPSLLTMDAQRGNEPLTGCTRSHQRAVQLAAEGGYPCVGILEDDVKFSQHFGDWEKLAEWLILSPFSLVACGVSGHNGARRVTSGIVEVDTFSGTQMMIIRQDIYRDVLAGSTSQHIDGIYSMLRCHKAVTVPFWSTQHAGHSDIRQRLVDDAALFDKQERSLMASSDE